jgi:adenylate cyclase
MSRFAVFPILALATGGVEPLDPLAAEAQIRIVETNRWLGLIWAAAREGTLGVERVERRLAAILAADVAGYSRLMERDEAGTLARLRALRRELIDPKVAEHKGRIVKTAGDGILIEFTSVVEAVACAVALQREMLAHNDAIPEDERIQFRVGINSGDVIVEDGDIHGDGVNVAARLEGVGEGVPAALPLPDKPSIAVLPFQNMSGDPEQEYFADGMVEEIITALSRIRWLFVIARNSSFTSRAGRWT